MSRVRGDIAGLLRMGSPVVAINDADATRGVFVQYVMGGIRCHVAWGSTRSGHPPSATRSLPRSLAMDLTDPTGMDHASRYIGTHYRLTFHAAPEFDRYAFGWPERVSGWAIRAGERTVVFVDADEAAESNWPTVRIVGLARAETHAEALALIVEHCAMEGK